MIPIDCKITKIFLTLVDIGVTEIKHLQIYYNGYQILNSVAISIRVRSATYVGVGTGHTFVFYVIPN